MAAVLPAGSDRNGPAFSRTAALRWMTIVLLLVFAFGANGLNTDPIWTDELYAISNMGGWDPPSSPAEIVSSVADNFPDHVPLFFLLGASWAHFVGWTQFALRLMPVLAGLLMIAWMYRLGSAMFSRFTGFVAALLLGTSAFIILYIHDFRMYSMFLMFAAMHFWLYWRLAHNRSVSRLTFALFVASAVALFYTHFFSIILFAGLGIYHLAFVSKSMRWLQLVAGWGGAVVMFLPYLPVLIAGVTRAAGMSDVTSRAASAPELILTFVKMFGNGSWLVVVLMVGILLVGLLRRQSMVLVKFMFIPVAMITLILSLNEVVGIIPLTRMRYFLILWIPLTIIAAAGLSLIPSQRVVATAILLIWFVAGFQFYRSDEIMNHVSSMRYTRLYPPMQNYVFHLAGRVRSEDYLLGFSDNDLVNKDLTLGNSVADYYTQRQLSIDGAFIQSRGYGEWLAGNIARHFGDNPYLIFIHDPQDEPRTFDEVYSRIEKNFDACDVILDEPDLYAQRHVHPLAGCDHEYAPISYENGIVIVDKFGKYDPDRDVVRVVTGWEIADEQQLDQYNVSIQIITPDWQMRKQVDRHLYNRIVKWNEVELPTEGLEPGDYRLVVILYDRNTNEKVQGTDLRSGETSVILPILTFTIEP